jgi:hypothetical protein
MKMQGRGATGKSMDGIDMLLRDTYNEILTLSGRYKAVKNNLSRYVVKYIFKLFHSLL